MKDYHTNDTGWQAGDRVMCMCNELYVKVGSRDIDDNHIFKRPATIVDIYIEARSITNKKHRLRPLAALRWDHKTRISRGHFLWTLERQDGNITNFSIIQNEENKYEL